MYLISVITRLGKYLSPPLEEARVGEGGGDRASIMWPPRVLIRIATGRARGSLDGRSEDRSESLKRARASGKTKHRALHSRCEIRGGSGRILRHAGGEREKRHRNRCLRGREPKG